METPVGSTTGFFWRLQMSRIIWSLAGVDRLPSRDPYLRFFLRWQVRGASH